MIMIQLTDEQSFAKLRRPGTLNVCVYLTLGQGVLDRVKTSPWLPPCNVAGLESTHLAPQPVAFTVNRGSSEEQVVSLSYFSTSKTAVGLHAILCTFATRLCMRRARHKNHESKLIRKAHAV